MIRLTDPGRVGPALGNLRVTNGRDQRDLAAASGINQPQLSGYEVGRHTPQLAAVFALAHALGYDLALVPREDA